MNRIEIYQGTENGQAGIGINVKDKSATLADLLDAWQPLCDDTGIYKLYGDNHFAVCKGCQTNCCNTAYVIPDIIAFKKMAALKNLDYGSFIAGCFDREKVAAGLLRMQPDPCIFLSNNICTVYSCRSLICRFYVCARMLGATEQLIYTLAWTGITALQIFAEQNALIKTNSKVSLSSFDLMFKKLIEEYRNKPQVELFLQAHEYEQIPLGPFLE